MNTEVEALMIELGESMQRAITLLNFKPRNRKQRSLLYIRKKNEWRAAHASVSPYPLIWKRDKRTKDPAWIISYSYPLPRIDVWFDELSNTYSDDCKTCGRPTIGFCPHCDTQADSR